MVISKFAESAYAPPTPMNTPTSASRMGRPASTSEPRVTISTTAATAMPMASWPPIGGSRGCRELLAATVSPSSAATASIEASRSSRLPLGRSETCSASCTDAIAAVPSSETRTDGRRPSEVTSSVPRGEVPRMRESSRPSASAVAVATAASTAAAGSVIPSSGAGSAPRSMPARLRSACSCSTSANRPAAPAMRSASGAARSSVAVSRMAVIRGTSWVACGLCAAGPSTGRAPSRAPRSSSIRTVRSAATRSSTFSRTVASTSACWSSRRASRSRTSPLALAASRALSMASARAPVSTRPPSVAWKTSVPWVPPASGRASVTSSSTCWAGASSRVRLVEIEGVCVASRATTARMTSSQDTRKGRGRTAACLPRRWRSADMGVPSIGDGERPTLGARCAMGKNAERARFPAESQTTLRAWRP